MIDATESVSRIECSGISACSENTQTADNIAFTSLYIPLLPNDIMFNGKSFNTTDVITDFFENHLCLGKIKRVDIATRPYKTANVKCVFVHFQYWYPGSEQLRCLIVEKGAINIAGSSPTLLFYSETNTKLTRYITLKQNISPISEVPALEAENMNIHQLVDNYKRIEKELQEKNAEIAQLQHLLVEEMAKVESIKKECVNCACCNI
jgi:hypothetical protein